MNLKGNEIIEIRDYLVDQLRHSSLQEWKILGYYLCKIDPRDLATRKVKITLEDYCALVGIGTDANIPYFRESTRKLLQTIIEGQDPDKNVVYSQTVLFQRCRMMADEYGRYYFELNASDDALPLMFDFKEHYIKARGLNIFRLSSPKQVLMYFLLRDYVGLGKWNFEISIDDIRYWLGIEDNEYKEFKDFKKRILDPCQAALKEYCDLSFSYERGKTGAHGKWLTLKLCVKENNIALKKYENKPLSETVETTKSDDNEISVITDLCKEMLDKSKLTGIEKSWINTWVTEYEITESLVKEAFNNNAFRSYLSLQHINNTLVKWHEHGIRTVESAKKFCEEEKKQNIRKAAKKTTVHSAKWKTGAEAGIVLRSEETIMESLSENKVTTVEEDDGIPSDILEMIGETADEEIDDSVDI